MLDNLQPVSYEAFLYERHELVFLLCLKDAAGNVVYSQDIYKRSRITGRPWNTEVQVFGQNTLLIPSRKIIPFTTGAAQAKEFLTEMASADPNIIIVPISAAFRPVLSTLETMIKSAVDYFKSAIATLESHNMAPVLKALAESNRHDVVLRLLEFSQDLSAFTVMQEPHVTFLQLAYIQGEGKILHTVRLAPDKVGSDILAFLSIARMLAESGPPNESSVVGQ